MGIHWDGVPLEPVSNKPKEGQVSLNRLNDRCDTCKSQAYVQVCNAQGFDLIFCAHHFTKFELQLLAQGFTIAVDERRTLTEHNRLKGSVN